MSRVDAIKEAIEALPEEDYMKLRPWFSEKDWQKWDKQIETDSRAGTPQRLCPADPLDIGRPQSSILLCPLTDTNTKYRKPRRSDDQSSLFAT